MTLSLDKNSDTMERQTVSGGSYKMKSTLMNKFFNEPVDVLDNKLENAEKNFSFLPIDPFMEVKQEQTEVAEDEHPLDCSEVQVTSPEEDINPNLERRRDDIVENNYQHHMLPPLIKLPDKNETVSNYPEVSSNIQRITLRGNSSSRLNMHSLPTGTGSSHLGNSPWRISPIPWQNLIGPSDTDLHSFPHSTSPPSPKRIHPPQAVPSYKNIEPQSVSSPSSVSYLQDNYNSRIQHFLSSQLPQSSLNNHGQLSPFSPQQSVDNLNYSDNEQRSPIMKTERISVIDYGREQNIFHKRSFDSDVYSSPSKKLKTSTDIDQRISLMETSATNSESFFSNPNPFLETPVKQESSWRQNKSFPILPSKGYLDRYQELIKENNAHNFKNSASHNISNNAPSSSQEAVMNCPLSPLMPQRMSSVIVRNNPNIPDSSYQTESELCQGPRSPPEGNNRYPMDNLNLPQPLNEREWCARLQNLRTGFALRMLEEQRQKIANAQSERGSWKQEQRYPMGSFAPNVQGNSGVDVGQERSCIINQQRFPFKQQVPIHQVTNRHPIFERIPPATITSDKKDQIQMSMKGQQVKSPEQVSHCVSSSGNFPEQSVTLSSPPGKGKRGRPRKHAPKLPLPPLYVFIRNLLASAAYNPTVVAWVDEEVGCFKVTNTIDFAKTWGRMKSNRSEEMNYEKMSRAMRYHYGCERQGRKGHLAMVKEKRLYYRFGELAKNWRQEDVLSMNIKPCCVHLICKTSLCLWTKE